MINKLQLLSSVTLALALGVLPGCGNKDDEDTGTGGSSTTDDGSTGSTTNGMTVTTNETNNDSSSGGMSGSETTADPTIDPTTDTGPVCENLGANGDACAEGCDCMSDECFTVGALGGVCSDCNEDADCADSTGFGCNFGNPLTGVPAVCSETGDLGEGCETTDACATDLFCTTLIDVPGIISASTCGECESDADCGGQICAPTYDIANIAGHYLCVDAGTIPDNEGCELSGTGAECSSGNCAPAAVMGIPVLGVCSPCNEDADCGGGTCQLPELTINGTALELVPGACI